MIYRHFFIVIAANLLTVSLNLLVEGPEPTDTCAPPGAESRSKRSEGRVRTSACTTSTSAPNRAAWSIMKAAAT